MGIAPFTAQATLAHGRSSKIWSRFFSHSCANMASRTSSTVSPRKFLLSRPQLPRPTNRSRLFRPRTTGHLCGAESPGKTRAKSTVSRTPNRTCARHFYGNAAWRPCRKGSTACDLHTQAIPPRPDLGWFRASSSALWLISHKVKSQMPEYPTSVSIDLVPSAMAGKCPLLS